MSYFSDNDDNGEFRDIPDEVGGQQSEIPQVKSARSQVASTVVPKQESVKSTQPVEDAEEYVEEQQEESEEDFSNVLSNARLRLEQGRLYEMIMNHNIFDGVEADEQAIRFVTKQMRNFAKLQMEVMLGMRQEEPKAQQLTIANFPFNDLEVQTLKALASAATKGVSSSPEAQVFSGVQTEAPKKRVGLNTISSPTKPTLKPSVPKPVVRQPVKNSQPVPTNTAQKPLSAKPATPIQRKQEDPDIDRILAEEGITREEYDRQYGNYKPLEKPLHKMTENEIIERNRKVTAQKAAKSTAAIPMPSPEQEEWMHAQRAEAAAAHPQMKSIMNLITQASLNKK